MEKIGFLNDDEYIEMDVHRYRPFIIGIIATWAVPEILIAWGFYKVSQLGVHHAVGYLYLGLAAMAALVAVLAYAFIQIYTRNRLLLTNKRVIIFTQHGLNGHKVAQCHLEFIQDVSTDHPNYFAEMFDYGDVSMETSGREENFIFHTSARPSLVAARIVTLCRMAKEGRNESYAEQPEAGPTVSLDIPDVAFELPNVPGRVSKI